MPIYTKWPRLLVVGQPVTEHQANEILIRTNQWWWLSCNDRDWNRTVQRVAVEHGWPAEAARGTDAAINRTRTLMAWHERHGMLSLEYLGNSQVMSSWIGGAHGWCDWSGRIGCTEYNIGKWPDDDEVTEEWQQIAAAFPYLDLTAQCVDDEGDGQLCAQWRVRGGEVEYQPNPTTLITALTEPDTAGWAASLVFGGRSERGVAAERLREAMAQVIA